MKILAIDTSCDESCAAVLDTEAWKILSDVVQSHVPAMTEYGGIVPELASREHLLALPRVVEQALNQAKLSVEQIDHIAITNRPGLIGALLVGLNFGKGLAWANQISFSVEDHIEGHLYSPMLRQMETAAGTEKNELPPFPWIALVVSGGHTELFHVSDFLEHRWLGGTVDDAAGEAFDKIGKILGLGYPAGPVIDRIGRETSPQSAARFPFPVASMQPFHFSYSGLKTAVNLKARSYLAQNQMTTLPIDIRNAMASSAQDAIVAQLVKEVRRALSLYPGSHAVVAGGVACNSRLRALLPEGYFPSPRHCTDNAAMIGLVAACKHKAGKLVKSDWRASAYARSDWPSMEEVSTISAGSSR